MCKPPELDHRTVTVRWPQLDRLLLPCWMPVLRSPGAYALVGSAREHRPGCRVRLLPIWERGQHHGRDHIRYHGLGSAENELSRPVYTQAHRSFGVGSRSGRPANSQGGGLPEDALRSDLLGEQNFGSNWPHLLCLSTRSRRWRLVDGPYADLPSITLTNKNR